MCPPSGRSRTCCPIASRRSGSRRASSAIIPLRCAEYCGISHSHMTRRGHGHDTGQTMRPGAISHKDTSLSPTVTQCISRQLGCAACHTATRAARAQARRALRQARELGRRPHRRSPTTPISSAPILDPRAEVVKAIPPSCRRIAAWSRTAAVRARCLSEVAGCDGGATMTDTTFQPIPQRAEPEGSYLEEAIRVALLAVHHGPQAHRHPLCRQHHGLLLHRRHRRDADPPGAADAAGRSRVGAAATTSCSRCTAS